MDVSVEEENLLIQLRRNVEDLRNVKEELLESKNLVRWLRARNHNFRDAEQMFRNHIAWRKEFDIERLAENEIPRPEGWEDYFTYDLCGFDKDGGPVYILYGKTYEVAKAFNAGHKDILIQRFFSEIERGWNLALKKSEGKNFIPQFIGILDFEDVSYRLINSTDAWGLAMSAPKIVDENYPECLHKIFVLNTPWYLMWLYKLVKATLSSKTAAKIVFLGYNKQSWRDEITKVLPADQFPNRYGGDGPNEFEEVGVQLLKLLK